MSATDRTDANAFEVGVAHVNFRVRCETLGHGDEVFLVSDEGQGSRKVGCYKVELVDLLPDRLPVVMASYGDSTSFFERKTFFGTPTVMARGLAGQHQHAPIWHLRMLLKRLLVSNL